MSLFNELKHRNVFRVAFGYIVSCWLLAQAADLVLENIGAPEWVMQTIMLVIALGFPVVVFFSWAYEVTPEGIKRESEIDRSQSITHVTGRKLDRAIMVMLIVALAYFAWESRFSRPETDMEQTALATASTIPQQTATPLSEEPTPVISKHSIAVLPFTDLSPEGDQAYFSDGIAEELLNLLVRVEGLKVASRTSSFVYKDQNRNIPEIAADLKVANILEGSVRKAGNRVRITAQLIDTRNDRHLWSDTFDRELIDIFAIQDEIATAIVSSLKDQLGVQATPEAIVVQAATGNIDAYDLYLKGRDLFIARQNLDEAIELFERAIELDPAYALAWEGLAATQRVANDWMPDDEIDHIPLSIQAARRALELNPELSMPYAVLAGPGMNPSPETGIDDLTEAERLLDLAVLKDPNNTTAWLWRGIHFNTLGYFDRAVADFDECLRRDPAYLNCVQHRAAALLFRGETDTALAALIPTLFENYHSMSEVFVPVLVEQGNSLAAVLIATAKLQLPYAPVGEWINALEHPDQDHRAGLARFDRWAAEYHYDYATDAPGILLAFGAFERAAQAPSLRFTVFGPDAKAFRKTGYFKQFVHDRGLEDYWRRHGFPPSCHVLDGQDFACN